MRIIGIPVDAFVWTRYLFNWLHVAAESCTIAIRSVSSHMHITLIFLLESKSRIRRSIVVSISACHAEDPGSIPGRGALLN